MVQHISWSQGHFTSPLISKSILWTSTPVWTAPNIGQFCLFLQITILIGRILLLLILLLIWHLIDLLFLLAHGQNPVGVIILMNSWPMYLVNLQTSLILIKPLVLTLIQGELKPAFLTLIQGELKPAFPTLSVALSLTSSIISYSNVVSTFVLILCNLIWTLQKSTLQ